MRCLALCSLIPGSLIPGSLILVAAAMAQAAEPAVGQLARVFDGDTISVLIDGEDFRLRLHAIDTPDQEQALYFAASDELRKRLTGRPLRVERVATTYGRQAAVILVDDEDINGEMIRAGYAYVHRKYLGMSDYDRRYCALEHEARVAGRGLWALEPSDRIAPWQLRQYYSGKRFAFTDFSSETVEDCQAAAGKEDDRAGTIAADPVPGLTPPDSRCSIKGDITLSGKRRYYVRGMRGYPGAFINEEKGERWFCSEGEAEQAGWERGRD